METHDLTSFCAAELQGEWFIKYSNSEHVGLPQTGRGGQGALWVGLGHTQSSTRSLCVVTYNSAPVFRPRPHGLCLRGWVRIYSLVPPSEASLVKAHWLWHVPYNLQTQCVLPESSSWGEDQRLFFWDGILCLLVDWQPSQPQGPPGPNPHEHNGSEREFWNHPDGI